MPRNKPIIRPLANGEEIPFDLLLLADESMDAINKYISNCVVYIIQISNATVGVCAIQFIDKQTIEIKNLAINEQFQNKGIGSWCLQQVEKINAGKDQLVGTGDASLSALRFYERHGFKRDFVRKNFFIENYPEPIVENGVQLKDQIVLMKKSR